MKLRKIGNRKEKEAWQEKTRRLNMKITVVVGILLIMLVAIIVIYKIHGGEVTWAN